MNIRECVKEETLAYEDRPIDAKVAEDLKVMIQQCNREGDMHFQLIQDELQRHLRVYLQNTANSQC